MTLLVRDLHFAVRALRRAPGFTIVVVLTLAAATGVNTAVFTVTNAVLFKGFRGVAHNERMVYIGTQRNGRGCCASFPDFVDWRARARSVSDLAAVADSQVVIADDHQSGAHYDATQISPNGFRLLGRRPILGRDFDASDAVPGARPVAIIQYHLWRTRYERDPAVLGRTLKINGTPTAIVGVMPEDFSFPQNQDLWLPLIPTPDLQKRDARTLWFAYGRLVDGVSIETARSEFATIGGALAAAYPRTNDGWIPRPLTFAEFFVGRDAAAIYGTLWAAVGFVVLIACANVANLVLARGLARAREWSTLAALGASRAAIVRRQVAESVVLSTLGAVGGWWIASAAVRLYATRANPAARAWSAHLFDYTMDGRTFAYIAILTIVTTILFGLLPATYLSRVAGVGSLDGRSVAGSRGQRLVSTILIAFEAACAVVLLVAAGVISRSFLNMARADLGIQPGHVQAMLVNLPRDRYRDERAQRQFFDRLTTRVAGEPTVRSVALASELPAGNGHRAGLELDTDVPTDVAHRDTISTVTVGPSYFLTVGATMLSGRDFTAADGATSPSVAIVNQRFVEMHWRGEDPLGKRLRLFDGAQPGPWLTVVGIASNVVQNVTDRQAKDPLVYRPFAQQPTPASWIVARIRPDAAHVPTLFRGSIDAIDPDVAMWIGPLPLTLLIAAMGNYWLLGNNTAMFAAFGIIALLLASLGIYAVVAYSVARRTKEFGIRMAIGATSADVLALVLRESGRPLGLGVAAGALGSLALTPALRSQLVHVSPGDPLVIASAVSILVACGLLGAAVPATRAARTGVATALRNE